MKRAMQFGRWVPLCWQTCLQVVTVHMAVILVLAVMRTSSVTWCMVYGKKKKKKKKRINHHGLSLRVNYTDRATAACRRSDCQLLRIEGATWSAWQIPTAVFSVFYTGATTFLSSSSSSFTNAQLLWRRLSVERKSKHSYHAATETYSFMGDLLYLRRNLFVSPIIRILFRIV
jgi:hypothetical protein